MMLFTSVPALSKSNDSNALTLNNTSNVIAFGLNNECNNTDTITLSKNSDTIRLSSPTIQRG